MSPQPSEPEARGDLEVTHADAVLIRTHGRTYVAAFTKGRDEFIVAGEVNTSDAYVGSLTRAVSNLFRKGRV